MRKYNGFTLVEILVVVSVMVLLTTITLINIEGILARTRDRQRIEDLNLIAAALERYHADNGRYPSAASPINVEDSAVEGQSNFLPELQPYLPGGVPIDPINIPCYYGPAICGGLWDWWYHATYRYNPIWWNPTDVDHHWTHCGTSDHYFLSARMETIRPGDPEYSVCTCPAPIVCGLRPYLVPDSGSTPSIDESACQAGDPVCGPEGTQAEGTYCCLNGDRAQWGGECNETVKGNMAGLAYSICGFGRNECQGTECTNP